MNVHDSEKMAGILMADGFEMTDSADNADLVVFNTCSIRQKAEQKFKSDLGRMKALKKKNPGLKVAVAGCIAQQRKHELFKRSASVDYVIGPQNIQQLKHIYEQKSVVAVSDNPDLINIDMPSIRNEKHRAWVNIMYGCDNYCTYCIVPYTRGRETSRPSAGILNEVRALANDGVKEITLLGQNVNSYKSDTDFPGLLRKLCGIDGIARIRFVTSHPRDLSDNLIDVMASEDKICEHIHLPMQSGSDAMLKAMNRGYTYGQYLDKVKKLKDMIPHIAITTDIIAGFPGETDADHRLTMKALSEIGYDGIFAFKYSKRPGTAAATMCNQLDEPIKENRLAEILEIQDNITLDINQRLLNSVQDVLVDGPDETGTGRMIGRTRTNKIVVFEGDKSLAGRFVKAKIVKSNRHSLMAEIV